MVYLGCNIMLSFWFLWGAIWLHSRQYH